MLFRSRLACGLLSTLLLVSELVAQERSRNDWNAAVNYWQAFGLMPDWTDEEKALRDTIPSDLSMALPAGVKNLIVRSGTALNALELANRVEKCDWQLEESQGPSIALPHLQKARELARQSQLRARYRFSEGDNSGGIADVLAKIGRAHV